MAIAFDTSSFDNGTVWTTHTLSHTTSWTNRFLVVAILIDNVSDLVTWVTYNSAAMTRIASLNNGSTESIYLYYLNNPSSGTFNVVATTSSSCTLWQANCSYTGVKQTGQPEQSNTNNYSWPTTSKSTSLTTTSNNCWTIWLFRANVVDQVWQAWTTIRTGTSWSFRIWDSNWPITPAWSTSLWVTSSSGTLAQIIASFAPAVTNNSNFFSFM